MTCLVLLCLHGGRLCPPRECHAMMSGAGNSHRYTFHLLCSLSGFALLANHIPSVSPFSSVNRRSCLSTPEFTRFLWQEHAAGSAKTWSKPRTHVDHHRHDTPIKLQAQHSSPPLSVAHSGFDTDLPLSSSTWTCAQDRVPLPFYGRSPKSPHPLQHVPTSELQDPCYATAPCKQASLKEVQEGFRASACFPLVPAFAGERAC